VGLDLWAVETERLGSGCWNKMKRSGDDGNDGNQSESQEEEPSDSSVMTWWR
jgi:hypothetical protein